MGGVDRPKYFWSGVTHMGGAAPPQIWFTTKIQILPYRSKSKIIQDLRVLVKLKIFWHDNFFEQGKMGAPWQKKSNFFAQKFRNSKFAINPFTNI